MKIPRLKLAVIDDEEQVTLSLERLLSQEFEVYRFTDPQRFLDALVTSSPEFAVVISDQRMPGMDGATVLKYVLDRSPDTIRILLTAYSDFEAIRKAINDAQIYRYLQKPWDNEDLLLTVREAARKYHLIKESKQLEQAKNQFLVLVSHELRTPIMGIESYAQLLQEALIQQPELKTYAEHILKHNARLKKVSEDSLLLIQLSQGQVHMNNQRFTFDGFTRIPQLLDQKLIQKKSLTWTCDLPPELNYLGDPHAFEQVMSRLLDNALRYSGENTSITISHTWSRPHRLNIQIQNQSTVMLPESFFQQLGQSFHIAHSIYHHQKGLGLGLAICQDYLKLCGSQLKIVQDQNKIVTVSFEWNTL